MPRWKRILIGLLLPLCFALLCLYERLDGRSLVCPFYALTGLYCPGCGSGRAVYALFHGGWRHAASYNILLFLLGIPAGGVLLHEYLRIVFPGLKLKPVYISQTQQTGCVAVVFLYWFLRNLSFFSFLAPA